MKMLVSGVYNLAGTSKGSGKLYSLHRVVILESIEQGGNMVHAYGFKAVEYEVFPEALNACIGKTFPLEMDVEVGLKNGKPLVLSIKPLPATPAKAA